MSRAIQILPQYTYADYVNWEGQWEIIHGIPYAKSPAPRPLHQLVASNISRVLGLALSGNECSCQVYLPIDYKIAEDIIVQPDLLIACDPIEKKYLDFAPALVVEILSDSTRLKDRHLKFSLYEKAAISYYIIVDADDQTVEIYQLNENATYKLIDSTHKLQLSTVCTIQLDVEKFWN